MTQKPRLIDSKEDFKAMVEQEVRKAARLMITEVEDESEALTEAPIPSAPAPAPPPAPAAAPAPAAPAPAPAEQQQAPDVDPNKVAGDGDGSDLQKGQVTLDMVTAKLNSIRSGHSFKDEGIAAQMQQYFNGLNDNEKLALYAFLKGISQIVTGGIQQQGAQQPAQPQAATPELEVVEKPGAPGAGSKVKHIKPNIIRKAAPAAGKPPEPQAAGGKGAPMPIAPKRR